MLTFAGINQYDLLKGWTDYLVNNTLFTSGQYVLRNLLHEIAPSSSVMSMLSIRFSADHNTVSNQTNLALKGIVAIKAMSQLSSALGNDVDAQRYSVNPFLLATPWSSPDFTVRDHRNYAE